MKIHSNIDLVQINLGSDNRYYLPESVDFSGKKINGLSILSARTGETTLSPFDARTLVDESELGNFYLELYNSDGKKIQQNLNAMNCNTRGNVRFYVDSIISLKLSNITYIGSTVFTDKCLLLYVSYDNIISPDVEISNRQLSIKIITDKSSVKLSDYVDEYIRRIGARVKAIEAYFEVGNNFYLDLREDSGKVFRMVPGDLLFANGLGLGKKIQPMLVNDFNIDFKNSYLYNATTGEITVRLTLYF